MDQARCRFFFPLLLYLPLISLATGADLNSDREALLAFAASVRLGRKLNWNSSSVCSSWIGVNCSADGNRVTALRLPGFGLAGPIPQDALGTLDALEVLSLRSNHLVGHIPSKLSSLPTLRFLHLQNNSLTGSLPKLFSANLSVLDLSYNSIDGRIPVSLENSKQLVWLNLQSNLLKGPVPDLNLPRLKRLNLSYNNLSGTIPPSLQRFPSSSFLGNSQLCGSPLARCSDLSIPSLPSLPSTQPPSSSKSSHRRKPSTRVIIAIAAGGFALLVLLAVVFFLRVCKMEKVDGNGLPKNKGLSGEKTAEQFSSGAQEAEKNKLSFFEGCSYNFDLDDLLRASAEVLGKGSYGTAYRAVLEDGTMVVVKRLKEVVVGKREFDQQMDLVGRISPHPNVLPLRAYYYSKDEKLMVYDYVHGGSLCNALHQNGNENRPLGWEARLKIAIGAARGIAHIHSNAGGKLTHGNVKSSNVFLLGSSACISDFALAPIMNAPATPRNVVGYRAPELFDHRKPTQKSDVYGFGVLLLEMLTGKAPLKSPGNDDVTDLPRWVQSIVREEWTAEVFDVELMKQPDIEEEMVQMLQIAMACVAKLPDHRPDMADVVRLVEEVRQQVAGSGNAQSSEDRSKDSNAAPSAEE